MNNFSENDSSTQILEFKTQHGKLIGVDGGPVEVSWKLRSSVSGLEQIGYRIQASSDPEFKRIVGDTFEQSGSSQFGISCPGPELKSREVRFFRVAVRTQNGWTTWSNPIQVETGLLHQSDFSAKFIGDNSITGEPSPILRKQFLLSHAPKNARIYSTALGIYDIYINGTKVGDSFLNPGWTAYHERLLLETHDVTNLLRVGQNVIAAELSDGWWRGRFGFMNQIENYGTEIALFAQLEITDECDLATTINSDSTWKVSAAEIRQSSIYDGCLIDQNLSQPGWQLPEFDDSTWSYAVEKHHDLSALKPRTAEPVREVARFDLEIEKHHDRSLLRGSQNISGWVELTVRGKKGQKITVRHAEVLEQDGQLHTRALREAKATDAYILAKDGLQTLTPKFTFHGFQHADVVTDAEILKATAVAISSETARRGWLETSDKKLNRLHENVIWSQLDNFVSIPTDCPQRDERLGWTGDAQAFAATSNTLFDTQRFWRSWLIDLALDQHPNGDVGPVVPDLLRLKPENGVPGWNMNGRAGWADAATIVPMSLYEYFGDIKVLQNQLDSMRRWADALDARRKGEKFLPTEFQFGDWCDPDAPGDKPWESKVPADFVANSFFAHTADLLAQVELLVGDAANAKRYRDICSQLKQDIWLEMGEAASNTTAGCSIALEFGIVPDAERVRVAKKLADLVRRDKGMITTGFLATPLILHALSKNGHFSEAYMMLMRQEFRSWLYAIDKGATTIWERWDAIREDGSIHTGEMATEPGSMDEPSMISFNHYAYGAVIDWMYRNVGGIAPQLTAPGFTEVLIAPRPSSAIHFAKCRIETQLGMTSLDWSIGKNGDFEALLELPFGSRANLSLPITDQSEIFSNGEPIGNGQVVSYGTYNLRVTNPQIISI
ncbi:MAG: hypothetical protein RL319_869 [Actinomycetota bacterium]|jgi:alpha-L-rhamnosidase